ncbi:hypothetical protein [Mesorhizobium sp. M0185]|uniref:hypothetical protein n=1 Tax=Mesorhizobium sp. M0185 TaxID=2956907 RepID=UPI00333BD308
MTVSPVDMYHSAKAVSKWNLPMKVGVTTPDGDAALVEKVKLSLMSLPSTCQAEPKMAS